jgi:hypothetical protein
MMVMKVIRATFLGLMMFACLAAGPANSAGDQVGTGLNSTPHDGETWSRSIDASNETELGLGLQPSGPNGIMRVAFSARLRGRPPLKPPTELTVHMAFGFRSNPLAVRNATLIFRLDERTKTRTVLDLSARVRSIPPGPNAPLDTATATMSPTEFLRVANATTVSANVLGLDVEFQRDQMQAVQAFGHRILLER